MGRGDLANGQRARLEPLLPTGIRPGRPQVWTRRQLTDGIRWRTRTGAPRRTCPNVMGRGTGSTTCSGVDTRFIETNKGILAALLDCGLPESRVNTSTGSGRSGGSCTARAYRWPAAPSPG
ncbi:transposase [Streptomyces sp. NPDC059224]|uniref:transposase n=1 Tax=Streptomyces sp. NPDC059224 TaxID=3346775 RepID=UPI00369A1F5B